MTVCVDGSVLLPDFTTGEVAGPVELDPGSYLVEVLAVNGGPAIAETFDVPAGANLTIAAYWEVGEGPALIALANDVSCVEAGAARATARHLADEGPVDVLAMGAPVFTDLANGEQDAADVPAGTYEVSVELVGGGVVIPPTDLDLPEAQNTIVSVIGGSDSQPSVILQTLALEVCDDPVDPVTPVEPVTPETPARSWP